MKITYALMLTIASFIGITDKLFSQTVEVQGQLKVTQVNQDDTASQVLVRNADGSLGKRDVSDFSGAISEVVFSTTYSNPKLNKLGYNLVSPLPLDLQIYYHPDSAQWINANFAFSTFNQREWASIDNNGSNSIYIFGGTSTSGYENTAARISFLNWFNPTIQLLPTANAPSPRNEAYSFVNKPKQFFEQGDQFPSEKLIIYGGNNASGPLTDGAVYDKQSNAWTTISASNAPTSMSLLSAIWTDTVMMTFRWNVLKKYNPNTNVWLDLAISPEVRIASTMVFTGSDILLWGGFNDAGVFQTSILKYSISNNNWNVINAPNAPAIRQSHKAIWTGNEMIVWGGWDQTNYLNSGGSYDPISNTWTSLSMTNAPAPRTDFACHWNGVEMYVYGGTDIVNGTLNNGARYNPVLNQWQSFSNLYMPPPLFGASTTMVYNADAFNFGKYPIMVQYGGSNNGTISASNKYLSSSMAFNSGPNFNNSGRLYVYKKVK